VNNDEQICGLENTNKRSRTFFRSSCAHHYIVLSTILIVSVKITHSYKLVGLYVITKRFPTCRNVYTCRNLLRSGSNNPRAAFAMS